MRVGARTAESVEDRVDVVRDALTRRESVRKILSIASRLQMPAAHHEVAAVAVIGQINFRKQIAANAGVSRCVVRNCGVGRKRESADRGSEVAVKIRERKPRKHDVPVEAVVLIGNVHVGKIVVRRVLGDIRGHRRIAGNVRVCPAMHEQIKRRRQSSDRVHRVVTLRRTRSVARIIAALDHHEHVWPHRRDLDRDRGPGILAFLLRIG